MSMTLDDRKQITMAYIRVCRDSGFKMNYLNAAHFAAKLISVHPIDIYSAIGSFEAMERIALGLHPVLDNPDYDNRRKVEKNV